jgi:hypothetical protein
MERYSGYLLGFWFFAREIQPRGLRMHKRRTV